MQIWIWQPTLGECIVSISISASANINILMDEGGFVYVDTWQMGGLVEKLTASYR